MLKPRKTQPQVQVLTEKAIYDATLYLIDSAKKAGTEIDIAMFYLSERKIIKALIAAHERGVKVRVLLDPNKDAFGRTKKWHSKPTCSIRINMMRVLMYVGVIPKVSSAIAR